MKTLITTLSILMLSFPSYAITNTIETYKDKFGNVFITSDCIEEGKEASCEEEQSIFASSVNVIEIVEVAEDECVAIQYRPAKNPAWHQETDVPPMHFTIMREPIKVDCKRYTRPFLKQDKLTLVPALVKTQYYVIKFITPLVVYIPEFAPLEPLEPLATANTY